jgi:hypothetical protein
MTDGPADRNGRTPAQVVREYVALRREWDLSTAERATGLKRGDSFDPERLIDFDQDAVEAAWLDLDRLRQQWCTPAVVARLDRRASFGNSSEFNPDGLVILGVGQASDDEVRLRTREYPFHDAGRPTDYDYRVRLVDGEWRLEDRAAEGIHHLL